jgi:hypothetical protein
MGQIPEVESGLALAYWFQLVWLWFFYGWGFCPLTDWHFRVIQKLGKTPLETSYILYLLNRLLHFKVDEILVDRATLVFYLVALATSVFLNIRDFKKRIL